MRCRAELDAQGHTAHRVAAPAAKRLVEHPAHTSAHWTRQGSIQETVSSVQEWRFECLGAVCLAVCQRKTTFKD